MNIADVMTGMDIIRKTAEHYGVTEDEIRRGIQETIDEAWSSNVPAAKVHQQQLFPKGKPCPEEFIIVVARHIKRNVQ